MPTAAVITATIPQPAWPYRDYVLKAFRDNMPFDEFTREQLAGDLIPNATTDQKVASAYNRILRTSQEGGIQDKEYLAKYGADRVRTTSAVWLGLTTGCAECHDHKFDPIKSQDFYCHEGVLRRHQGSRPDARSRGRRLDHDALAERRSDPATGAIRCGGEIRASAPSTKRRTL